MNKKVKQSEVTSMGPALLLCPLSVIMSPCQTLFLTLLSCLHSSSPSISERPSCIQPGLKSTHRPPQFAPIT